MTKHSKMSIFNVQLSLLEHDLQRELNLARGRGRLFNHARRWADSSARKNDLVRGREIGQLKHHVFGDLAFHRQAPLLDGGREHIGINACRGIDRTGLRYRRAASRWRQHCFLKRNQGKEWCNELLAGLRGWIGMDPYAQLVL